MDNSWDRPDDEYFVWMSWKIEGFKIHKLRHFRQYPILQGKPSLVFEHLFQGFYVGFMEGIPKTLSC